MARFFISIGAFVIFQFGILASHSLAAAELNISAGTACQGNVFKFITKAFEEKTKIKLNVLDGNNSPGIMNHLHSGAAEAGCVMGGVEDFTKGAKEGGADISRAGELKQRTIGRDRISIVVNKDVVPASLSNEQISGLLSGKITNWKSISGKDVPAKLIFMEQTAANMFMKKRFIPDVDFVKGANFVDIVKNDRAKMLETVANTPGAYSFISSGALNDKVKVPKHEIIGRPIYFIYYNKSSPNLDILNKFIVEEGSKLGVFQ